MHALAAGIVLIFTQNVQGVLPMFFAGCRKERHQCNEFSFASESLTSRPNRMSCALARDTALSSVSLSASSREGGNAKV